MNDLNFNNVYGYQEVKDELKRIKSWYEDESILENSKIKIALKIQIIYVRIYSWIMVYNFITVKPWLIPLRDRVSNFFGR